MRNTEKPPIVAYAGHDSEGLLYLNVDRTPFTFRVDTAKIDGYLKRIRRNPAMGIAHLMGDCNWYLNEKEGRMIENGI
jgi:hypothetical protein